MADDRKLQTILSRLALLGRDDYEIDMPPERDHREWSDLQSGYDLGYGKARWDAEQIVKQALAAADSVVRVPIEQGPHNPWDSSCSRHGFGEPSREGEVCLRCHPVAEELQPTDRKWLRLIDGVLIDDWVGSAMGDGSPILCERDVHYGSWRVAAPTPDEAQR